MNEGVDKAMALLKEHSLTNHLDYQFVMDCLKDFKSPRSKLSRLVQSGALIRIKKGLYLLGTHFKHTPYCPEMLANLIYGPSYVSLESALQMYGMIPEHVVTMTSVTVKSAAEFKTPIGHFSYSHCSQKSYPIGITTKTYSDYEKPLLATPEKALTDFLKIRRGKVTSVKQLEHMLIDDLRIEEEDLSKLDLKLIRLIQNTSPHSSTYFLEKFIGKFHE